ncbi:hypothetical protein ACFQL4_21320 [Halosimplex aquaticum]
MAAADGTADAASAVSVETTWAETGTDSSYSVGGNVTFLADGADAAVWFEYRAEGANAWQTTRRQTVSSAGGFDAYLTGLTAGETYEYRARAEAGNDSAAGTVRTFAVPDEPPAVATTDPERVTERGATLRGSVEWLAGADSAEAVFLVSPVGSDEVTATSAQTITDIGSVNRTFGQLVPNTTYEYRLHVRASDGDNATGSWVRFTTDSEFAASTTSARAVNETAVTAVGEIADLGGADAATATVEYRRGGATEWTVARRAKLASAGDVTATITGLEPGTKYEVRVAGEERRRRRRRAGAARRNGRRPGADRGDDRAGRRDRSHRRDDRLGRGPGRRRQRRGHVRTAPRWRERVAVRGFEHPHGTAGRPFGLLRPASERDLRVPRRGRRERRRHGDRVAGAVLDRHRVRGPHRRRVCGERDRRGGRRADHGLRRCGLGLRVRAVPRGGDVVVVSGDAGERRH